MSAVDSLYEAAEAAENWGVCPFCEVDALEDGEFAQEHILCLECGVCFKYHHSDWCDLSPNLEHHEPGFR